MGLVHLVVDMQEIDVAFVNVVRHDYYDCRGKDGRDLLLLREGGIHVYKLNLCVDSGQKNAVERDCSMGNFKSSLKKAKNPLLF